MSKERSTKDIVLEKEKEGTIIFISCGTVLGMKIDEFIKQPAEGILYDLNRDKVTLLSQFSEENIRWINDYAVAVTIAALKAEIDRLKSEMLYIPILPKWIPVSERLPEKRGAYYVYLSDDFGFRPDIDFFENGDWNSYTVGDVTHWMPLPAEPPSEEK